MNRFSIRDLENLTGIKAHTIRIWEQRYGILQPKRTPTNIRYYDAADLKLALRVSLLNQYGYKISRIHRMSDGEMTSLIETITDASFRLQAETLRLLDATLEMDVSGMDRLLTAYISSHGIEYTVEHLVFQFLEKIGLMWLTDRLAPAQEHLASNVIKRKIAVAIERLPAVRSGGLSVVLFLPEREIHDIGLWYVHYLLRKAGIEAAYLGGNTPLSDVQAVYTVRKPSHLYLHLTVATGSFDAPEYLKKLCSEFPDVQVLASGALLQHISQPRLPNLQYLMSLAEVRDTFSAIAREGVPHQIMNLAPTLA